MRRRLYLHAGVHRTGTTAIQRWLQTNAGALAARGFLHPFGAGRHVDLMGRIFDGAQTAAAVVDEIEARAGEYGAGGAVPIHSVILSDEDICARRDLSVLAGFADTYEIRVVLSVRRQDLWLESWYRQNVKWQWNRSLAHLTFPQFMARRGDFFWIDYTRRVADFEAVFGAGSVSIRIFETESMPDGAVADFCAAIGLVDRAGLTPPRRINGALSPVMSEFLRGLPLDRLSVPVRAKAEAACVKADGALRRILGPQSALYLSAPARAALLNEYGPGNAVLAQRLGRAALFTAPLPAPDAALAVTAPPPQLRAEVEVLLAQLRADLGAIAGWELPEEPARGGWGLHRLWPRGLRQETQDGN